MSERTALMPAAVRRIRTAVLLPMLGGNLLVFVVASLALLIPDSHAWQLLLSTLVALGLMGALLLWNSIGLLRFREGHETAQTKLPLWQSALLLGGWFLLAALLFHLISLALPNVEIRAGFWNSRLSAGLRHLLPYGRLITLQHAAIRVLQWVLVPELLLPFCMETVTLGLHAQSLRNALRILRSVRYWTITAVALGIALWLTPVLVDWHPTDTVHGEIVSAALRLSLVVLLDAGALLLVLAVDAELLYRAASEDKSAAGL